MSKDKNSGKKSAKTTATRSLKEKRAFKAAKREEKERASREL